MGKREERYVTCPVCGSRQLYERGKCSKCRSRLAKNTFERGDRVKWIVDGSVKKGIVLYVIPAFSSPFCVFRKLGISYERGNIDRVVAGRVRQTRRYVVRQDGKKRFVVPNPFQMESDIEEDEGVKE